MLSVWIDFGLEMRGLTVRVPALGNVHVKTTTRITSKVTSSAGNDFVNINF